MKLRSYYALALLLSCISPITSLRAEHQNDLECITDFDDQSDPHVRAGSMIEATSVSQLNAIIANNPRVVVDFYAPWCGPCKRMAPEFAKLPGAFSDIVFVKISVDILGVSSTFGIKSMPTIICYKDGQKASQVSGAKSFNDLKNYVSGVFHS